MDDVAYTDELLLDHPGMGAHLRRPVPQPVDDLIDQWHDARPGDPAHGVPLHTWLGMSWDEYRQWLGPR